RIAILRTLLISFRSNSVSTYLGSSWNQNFHQKVPILVKSSFSWHWATTNPLGTGQPHSFGNAKSFVTSKKCKYTSCFNFENYDFYTSYSKFSIVRPYDSSPRKAVLAR